MSLPGCSPAYPPRRLAMPMTTRASATGSSPLGSPTSSLLALEGVQNLSDHPMAATIVLPRGPASQPHQRSRGLYGHDVAFRLFPDVDAVAYGDGDDLAGAGDGHLLAG